MLELLPVSAKMDLLSLLLPDADVDSDFGEITKNIMANPYFFDAVSTREFWKCNTRMFYDLLMPLFEHEPTGDAVRDVMQAGDLTLKSAYVVATVVTNITRNFADGNEDETYEYLNVNTVDGVLLVQWLLNEYTYRDAIYIILYDLMGESGLLDFKVAPPRDTCMRGHTLELLDAQLRELAVDSSVPRINFITEFHRRTQMALNLENRMRILTAFLQQSCGREDTLLEQIQKTIEDMHKLEAEVHSLDLENELVRCTKTAYAQARKNELEINREILASVQSSNSRSFF